MVRSLNFLGWFQPNWFATRLSRERKVHSCQFSSILDAGRDFLCGVRISSYEAAGELGFNLQGGSAAEGRGEEGGGNTVF